MKWTELLFKALSALAIPLALWGVKLEVNNAVQEEKLLQLSTEVAAAKSLRDILTTQSVSLGKIEEQINATNRRLDDIKGDFRRSLPPAP